MNIRSLSTAVLTGLLITTAITAQQPPPTRPPTPPAAPSTPPPASTPVNLNSATAADLEKLPGIGPAVAARILEYRQKNGGFKKVEELMNIRGIGEKTFLRLKTLLVVTPPKMTDR
jgi:competence protein ComEA